MSESTRAHWQLPRGVTRGMWDYAHSEEVADDFDNYFAAHRLLQLDQQLIEHHVPVAQADLIADLGCGTGRALMPLVRRGAHGLAIDLSDHMLRIVQNKVECEDLPVFLLRANLVQLDCLAANSVDHALCLFSTLGMIQGSANRRQALHHVRRILKPDGRFVLHVHNYWSALFDPGGPFLMLKNLFDAWWRSDVERGDSYFPYRGVPRMFLHTFTAGELRQILAEAGFCAVQWKRLNARQNGYLGRPWFFGGVRANGWLIVCV